MLSFLALMSCLGLPTQTAEAAIPEATPPADGMIVRECLAGFPYAQPPPTPVEPPPTGPPHPVTPRHTPLGTTTPTSTPSAMGGHIKGTVIDEAGLEVRGALLTIRSPAMIGGAQQVTTDEYGNFRFDGLPAGSYEVLAEMQGFGPVKKTGVEVLIGRTTQMTFELKSGSTAVVVVGERATIDTTTMTNEFLSKIPTGRSYQSALDQTAGVTGSGNPNSGGASSNENTILLDGVNTTDPVTGTFSTARKPRAPAPAGQDAAVRAPNPAPLVPSSLDWGATVYLSNDDSMSLASAQRLLWAVERRVQVSPAQVRPHELLNYFSFDTAPVNPGDTFSVLGSAEQSEPDKLTVAFAVRGVTPPHAPLDLTIVLDRSGSMSAEGRMEYLKRGLLKMKEGLQPGDRLDFVLFDDRLCTPLENFVVGRDDEHVLDAMIQALQPRGSTDMDLGLREGYRIATAGLTGSGRAEPPGRNRRVLLITDAELNTGSIDPDVVSEIGRAYERSGVRLTAVGVGRNFRDDVLDKLSEKGKGAYVYLGSEAVVDRIFGVGFESLTRTIAHDVQLSVNLPPSLAMERFYGEESSTDPADVQPIHYYAGTTQLFLQDLQMKGKKPVTTDPVTFLIHYTDPDTGEARSQSWQTSVGTLLESDPRNVNKGQALMAWTDFVLARAMTPRSYNVVNPCPPAFATWQDRVAELGPDTEIGWLDGITAPLCQGQAVTFPLTPRVSVPYTITVDSDAAVSGATLTCGRWSGTEALSGSDKVARFDASPGVCNLTVQGAVPLATQVQGGVPLSTQVQVPAVGGKLRCLVRAGAMSCS